MDTKPKPFIFVLMPFEEKFMEIYQLGIKFVSAGIGAYCERVDEQVFSGSILERIYNQIAKADIIISDMTGRNPNVFYETGYAHALNKQVILLTQQVEDIPFDLKHYPHIVYSGKILTLQNQLEPRLRWCLENPSQSLSSVDINLQFFVNNIFLIDNPLINIHTAEKTYQRAFSMNISLHNLGQEVIEPNSFKLSLIVPEFIEFEQNLSISSQIQIPGNKRVLNLRTIDRLFPEDWDSLQLECYILTKRLSLIQSDPSLEFNLRLLTELGPKDLPFIVKLKTSHTP